MASFKNTLIAALALAYTASAVPLAVEKRAPAPEIYTETTWVTVDVTTTIWVPPTNAANQVAPAAAPATATGNAVVQPIPSSSPPAVAAAAANSPAAFAAQPQAPQSQPQAAQASTPPAANTPPAAPAAAPVASSSAAAPAAASSAAPASGGSSAGGPCNGQANACTGDITHYDGGLGACGWNVDTNTDYSIALPYQLMGTQSNGNPYCGRTLSIKGTNGNIVQAKVGDKCMGCTGDSIDLTDVLFTAVAPNGDGRVHNIEWWFN